MLIDAFADNWLEELAARARDLRPLHRAYLLVDGVFVPGLHRSLPEAAKSLLFESLPGCSEKTRDVSPFLTPCDPDDKTLISLLRRCSRWPMVSLIETAETLRELGDRLAAWCVIEADGQRFNFRFTDTRRLPGIFRALSPTQRAQLAGPAARWSYMSRQGYWRELEMDRTGDEIAFSPALDQAQFAMLVDDSRSDELLTVLSYRGHDTYRHPSRSHELLTIALRATAKTTVAHDELVDWCEWFWNQGHVVDDLTAAEMLGTWRNAAC